MPAAGWYVRRLSRMGPTEVVARLRARATVETWRRKGFPAGPASVPAGRYIPLALPEAVWAGAPQPARARLLDCADQLLAGTPLAGEAPPHRKLTFGSFLVATGVPERPVLL